jgi:hypothetical protein
LTASHNGLTSQSNQAASGSNGSRMASPSAPALDRRSSRATRCPLSPILHGPYLTMQRQAPWQGSPLPI